MTYTSFHCPQHSSQPDFSAEDLLWVLYILYSLRKLAYLPQVIPWEAMPRELEQARKYVTKACELRPNLPYGFEVAAAVFQNSSMNDLSYAYAEKVRKLFQGIWG